MPPEESRFDSVVRRAQARASGLNRPDPSLPPVPDTGRLIITCTFSVLSGWGMVHNPKIAIWIEDENGELVRVVAIQRLEGINTLAQWHDQLGHAETTTSSTKPAGSYRVVWDGADESGSRVPTGEYYVCIEASRDNGPRELIRHRIQLGQSEMRQYLPDSGELTAAMVTYSV